MLLRLLQVMHLTIRIRQFKRITLNDGSPAIHLASHTTNWTIQLDSHVITAGFEFPLQRLFWIPDAASPVSAELMDRTVTLGPLPNNGAIAARRTGRKQ